MAPGTLLGIQYVCDSGDLYMYMLQSDFGIDHPVMSKTLV